jgi:hypothetical protein
LEILVFFLVFLLGCAMGFLLRSALLRFRASGTIVVSKTKGKTLYTLVLDDYPEKLEFRKNVVFKVDSSEESLDRE